MVNKTKTNVKAIKPAQLEVKEETTEEKLNIVLKGKAPKLNPTSKDFIHFEINRDKKVLTLRIISNDGGGLFSKEWLKVDDILAALGTIKSPTEAFNSTIFKPLFIAGSANNASFLAAILRSKEIALIAAVPSKMYSHQLSVNFAENRKKLLALTAK